MGKNVGSNPLRRCEGGRASCWCYNWVMLGTAVGVTVGARVGFTVVMNVDAVVGRYIAPLILPTDMKRICNFPKLYDLTPVAGAHRGVA